MRNTLTTLLALFILAAGGLAATPAAASASCTSQYYVCLNNQVYAENGLRAELEAVECGLKFWGCLAREL